jgi:hypothetical protein
MFGEPSSDKGRESDRRRNALFGFHGSENYSTPGTLICGIRLTYVAMSPNSAIRQTERTPV